MPCTAELTITSETRHLTRLRRWVEELAQRAGSADFPPEILLPCKSSLIEAVDNAIFHAHKGRADMPITISLTAALGCVTLEVTDGGKGFDAFQACEPDPLSEDGRGLFIIKSFSKKVESIFSDGRHTLSMTFGAK